MTESLRTLLIEDSEADAELVLRELRRGGYTPTHRRVETADELRSALDGHEWDIILSDYSMPAFDGLRAFRICCEANLDVPFIIVSGTVGEEVAVTAMREGIHDYLLKDNLSRLCAAVAREVREATNRRQARKIAAALEIQERRYRSIFNSASVSQWEVDLTGAARWLEHQGVDSREALDALLSTEPTVLVAAARGIRIHDVNDTTVSMLEVQDKDQVIGSLLRVLSFGFEGVLRQILYALTDGRSLVETEATVVTPPGRQVDLLISAHLPNRREDLANVVVTSVDITDRRRLETQMRAAQRMEAVGRLAGGIAHDFNNVLTVVQSYASLLLDEMAADAPERNDLEQILRAADRAARLTNQLLAYSRRQVQQLELLNLNDVVASVEDMLRRLMGEDVQVEQDLAPDLGVIRADPTQVEQVIMNLAINARDAMPSGGKVTIRTANVTLGEPLPINAEVAIPPGAYIQLALADTGVGIDEQHQSQVFEPFFTTKAIGKGTGLGLSTVYGIVKQSGAYVALESVRNRGTTFTIYLPRWSGAMADVRRVSAPAAGGGTETVLIVEDEEIVRDTARRILEHNGYTVITAAHPDQALAIIEAEAERIDLMLTDVVMPGTSGRHLAEHVAARAPALPVLYMSGYADATIAQHGILDDDVTYLRKPFTPQDLLQAIRGVLNRPTDGGGGRGPGSHLP